MWSLFKYSLQFLSEETSGMCWGTAWLGWMVCRGRAELGSCPLAAAGARLGTLGVLGRWGGSRVRGTPGEGGGELSLQGGRGGQAQAHGAGTQRSHCRGAWLSNGKVTQGWIIVLRQLQKPLLPEELFQPLQSPQEPGVGTAFHLFFLG